MVAVGKSGSRLPMNDKILAESIADRLRRDILRGVLAPGARIKERDRAAEMGVSRTPMREAVRILVTEGLVQLRPARSPVVADPTLKDVTDAITVLKALEVLSGRLACINATDDEITEIHAIQEEMEHNYNARDLIDTFEVDMAFHRAIARASHNPALAQTHDSYLGRLWRARYLSAKQKRSRERVLRQHNAILAGLDARAPARISAEIETHLEAFMQNVAYFFEQREETGTTARVTPNPTKNGKDQNL